MSKARDLANAGTALGAVTATELAYVDGVTSAIQTQIDSKIGSASAINPTIVDAKGDIIAATAADTVARLAVGANGTVLTAASGQATGLEWATPSSGGMTLISTTTLSGATTTLSSIPQTYNSLMLIITGAGFDTSNGQLVCWPNSSGNNVTNNVSLRGIGGTGATISYSDFSPIYLQGNQTGRRDNTDNIFVLQIFNYTSSTTGKAFSNYAGFALSDGATSAVVNGGHIKTNTAITSLVLGYDNGNAANSGTIKFYGVK